MSRKVLYSILLQVATALAPGRRSYPDIVDTWADSPSPYSIFV